MTARSAALKLALLLVAAVVVVLLSALLGPSRIGLDEIFGSPRSAAFWDLRFPRTMLAAAAGAGLAVGGAVFQSLFRNPLATPFTLGISSGASLAAAVGIQFGVSGYWDLLVAVGGGLPVPRISALAFAGAAGAMGLVWLMARLRGGRDMTRLLLAGVCVSYLSAAGIMLATYLSDGTVTNSIVLWLMGSLARLVPGAASVIALVLVPVLGFTLVSHRSLDLIAMGEHAAATRGVAVGRTIWACYALVGLLTAVIVAYCGPIGFVGLMIPHVARALLGVRFLPVVLGSALIGAAFLAACDGLARSMVVYEVPVGIVTNVLGAAFFFYLLATREVAYARPG